MSDLLAGCRTKIDWGHKHLQRLEKEVRTYIDSRPHTFLVDSDADGTEQRLIVRVEKPQRVLTWPLLLSDCLHNFRGALDHLIYAMAIHASQESPPPLSDELQFPIAGDAARFQERGLGAMKDDATIRAAVESVQPYGGEAGDGAALLLLAELNDTDKHRLLHVLDFLPEDLTTGIGNLPAGTYTITAPFEPLEDGATAFLLTASVPSPKMKVDPNLRAGVAVRHTSDIPGNVVLRLQQGESATELLGLLNAIEQEVCRILNALKRFAGE